MHRWESSIYCMLIIYVETFAYWPVIIWQLQILFKHQTKIFLLFADDTAIKQKEPYLNVVPIPNFAYLGP